MEKHKAVFKTELGQAKNIVASLHIASDTKTVFCKASPVPYALLEKVENELKRLQRENLVTGVKFSLSMAIRSNGSSMIGSFRVEHFWHSSYDLQKSVTSLKREGQ